MAKKADKDVLLVAVDFSPYSEQALGLPANWPKT